MKRHCRKQIFDISEKFTQYNKGSFCENITGGTNIFI